MEEIPPNAQQYSKMDADPRPDAELLRQSYAGDESAFRVLVDRHARYLTGVARSLCGNNAADAEDVVQETFVAALTSRFRGESAVRTWLVQIVVRQAALLRRKRTRERGSPVAVETERATLPESAMTDARIDVAKMLEGLSEDQREVIVLRELEGMSYEDMAKTLHVPRGTIESRLHRARAALKQLFRGYF